MQVRMWRKGADLGLRRVAIAIALGVAVSGVWPAGAEEPKPIAQTQASEPTGNMVFFKGGFVGFNSNRGGEFFTDCGLASTTCGQNNSSYGQVGPYVGISF
ncbi:MAG TPA: hypothetical protein VJL88_09095 [Nitrospira sp.]|nr:hypothetical protein [Nitrospira sp.]